MLEVVREDWEDARLLQVYCIDLNPQTGGYDEHDNDNENCEASFYSPSTDELIWRIYGHEENSTHADTPTEEQRPLIAAWVAEWRLDVLSAYCLAGMADQDAGATLLLIPVDWALQGTSLDDSLGSVPAVPGGVDITRGALLLEDPVGGHPPVWLDAVTGEEWPTR